jgi:hypothetical protein
MDRVVHSIVSLELLSLILTTPFAAFSSGAFIVVDTGAHCIDPDYRSGSEWLLNGSQHSVGNRLQMRRYT